MDRNMDDFLPRSGDEAEGAGQLAPDNLDNNSDDDLGAEKDIFVDELHSANLLLGLRSLQTEGLFCDVTLVVEGKHFLVHKNVLAAFSPYFKAMFTTHLAESTQREITINGIEENTMELLMNYTYTGSLPINTSNVQSLLSAANLLQFEPVKNAASAYLEKNLSPSNCIGIENFAESHDCTSLAEKARAYAIKNFQEVCKGEEFVSLSQEKLIEFIQSDDLEIENEETLFSNIIKWYNHDPEKRSVNFCKILEHVRLPLMNPYFIIFRVENMPIIQNCPECKDMISEAKTFHLIPERSIELESKAKQRLSASKIEVIIAVGGEDDKVVLRSVECYEPKIKMWASLSCLPYAVSKHGLVVSGKNVLYLAGGEHPNGTASRSVYRYDPILDSWQEMAKLLVPRSELGLVMLDSYMYAIGGWEGASRLDSVEKYDPSDNTWRMVAPLEMALTSPACVTHDGLLYVAGGAVLEEGDGISLFQRYDPVTDTWMKLAPMLIPRSGSAACVLGNYIYIIGGWHASTENTRKVERYDITTNTWEFVAPMIKRRYRPGATVADGKIFVLGGEEGWDRYHKSVEVYDAENDSWSICGEMPSPRSWLGCAKLLVKKVHLANKE